VAGDSSQAGTIVETARHRFDALWLLIPAVALLELGGHAAVRSAVPSFEEWGEAAAFVSERIEPSDALTAAPGWVDPILRLVLGDRISLAVAGRSDLAAYDRLWALSIRGERPPDAPPRDADFSKRFGRVEVLRWELAPSTVLADLVAQLPRARVSVVRGGVERACPPRRMSPGGDAGLGKGPPPPPGERFFCPEGRGRYWVAPVVMEDLDLKPRRCVRQPPLGEQPVRVAFRGVPLGERIVFYGGLYYEDERHRRGKPVRAAIRVNGEKVGTMIHRDGEGWKRLEVSTRVPSRGGPNGDIAIEVTAGETHRRTFCWAASTRGAAARGRP
jgi:hypothetical protein